MSDKGDLERARRLANRLAKHFIGEQFAAEDETCSRCVAMVTDALAAAEAEARAAAIAECAAICDLYEGDLRKVSKVKPYVGDKVKYDSAANMVGGCATAIRALATPAQSPGIGWKISDETAAELENADNNLRDAPRRALEAPPLGATPAQTET